MAVSGKGKASPNTVPKGKQRKKSSLRNDGDTTTQIACHKDEPGINPTSCQWNKGVQPNQFIDGPDTVTNGKRKLGKKASTGSARESTAWLASNQDSLECGQESSPCGERNQADQLVDGPNNASNGRGKFGKKASTGSDKESTAWLANNQDGPEHGQASSTRHEGNQADQLVDGPNNASNRRGKFGKKGSTGSDKESTAWLANNQDGPEHGQASSTRHEGNQADQFVDDPNSASNGRGKFGKKASTGSDREPTAWIASNQDNPELGQTKSPLDEANQADQFGDGPNNVSNRRGKLGKKESIGSNRESTAWMACNEDDPEESPTSTSQFLTVPASS